MPEIASFDHYEVLTRDDGSLFELGRGAMGVTYKAFDTSLRFPVCLKVINAAYLNSEVARQRFIREARSAAKLRHRNVASVFHLGTEGDTWFYAMEFIDGETLDAVIKREGTLAPKMALEITAQVARALNAASQHGLVHRDIKPANLMLVHEDDEVIAKVIDFGLAKTSIAEGEDTATLSMGGFVGTPHFASPEQLEELEIDVRSDIYSLGVTLWYMLAGQPPFGGSMAQVMSQHLSKPPPFDKFKTLPPAVADLLRKMLEKDPANRFQTPSELRRVIEDVLGKLSHAPAAEAPAPAPVDQEDFATLLETASVRPGDTRFEPGVTIAGRYRITEALGETNAGRAFRAQDHTKQREVRLLVLHKEFLNDASVFTSLEREVERLAQVQHPNLLGVFEFATIENASFLATEWTSGFSLLELLRARRELGADEAILLLKQAAVGVDYALRRGLAGLEFGLHQVMIHFPDAFDKGARLHEQLSQWPAFTLKLYPLGVTRDLTSSQTWAGGQTVVGGGASQSGSEAADDRGRYIRSLAAILYELLGGALSPLMQSGAGLAPSRYTPLSTLSEEGNEVLKHALDPSFSFPGAQEFCNALSQLDGLQVARRDSVPTVTKYKSTPPPIIVPAPPLPKAAPGKSRAPAAIIGLLACILAIGGGAYFVMHRTSGTGATDRTDSGTTDLKKPDVGDDGKTAEAEARRMAAAKEKAQNDAEAQRIAAEKETARKDAEAQRIAAEKEKANKDAEAKRIAAEKEKTNDVETKRIASEKQKRLTDLTAAIGAAEKKEGGGDVREALKDYLKIIRDFADIGSKAARKHIETLFDRLRESKPPTRPEEFEKLQDLIVESAQEEVVSAMLILAENMRKDAPKESYRWFLKAADSGNPYAINQLGLMLSNGIPGVVVSDLPKSVEYFQSAADLGYAPAKHALAQCYLEGKGVARNEKKGLTLLHEAIAARDVRAMNYLGSYLTRSADPRPDAQRKSEFAEAFNLFSEAKELGYLDAEGNLGIMYYTGRAPGAKAPDYKKAAELFSEGAKKLNPLCMRCYAACLEEGRGTKPNQLEAEYWFVKAAKAGEAFAIKWCKDHKIPLPSEPAPVATKNG